MAPGKAPLRKFPFGENDRLHSGVHLYGAGCFFVFALIYWLELHSAYLAFSNMGFGTLTLVNWALFRNSKASWLNASLLLMLVYVGLLNAAVHVGVGHGPLVFWGLSLVVAAAFMYRVWGLVIWTALSLLFFPIASFLKTTPFNFGVLRLTPGQDNFLELSSYAGLLLFVAFTLFLYQGRLRRAALGLERSEERYRTLFTAEDDAIIIFNPQDLRLVDANPSACRLYGYTRSEILGRKLTDLSTSAADRVVEAVRDRVGRLTERVHRRKDGTSFPVEVTTSFFSTREGEWAVGIIRDTTERQKARAQQEDLLRKESLAHQEADRANLTKDVFLATLSHELRTPLHAIKLWSELLNAGQLDEAKKKRGLEIIGQSVTAQARIIDDLLDVSRIMAGKLHLEIQAVNVQSLAREAVDALRGLATEKGVMLELALEPALGTLQADPVRLKQVIWNLVNNAIKFTPTGGHVQLSLEGGREQGRETLLLKVKDEGQGIAGDMLTRIFEPFTQADGSSARVHGGLGLGLTIVKNLVELHQGTVSVSSPGPGRGALFTVELPISPFPRGSRVPMRPSLITTRDLSGVKVLAVDDDGITRQAQVEILKLFGAEVRDAASADEAFALLGVFQPHLILSDIAMPGRDGYSLLAQIRESGPESLRQIPAVALTAFGGAVEKQRILDAGFQAHLEKPVESAQLVQTLKSVLRPHI